MRYDTFPDAEAIAGYALRAAAISGLSTRVYSSIPKRPTYPLVVVKRIGGLAAEIHRLDQARLQIDVWGNPDTGGKGQARDIAAAARTALLEMEGKKFTAPPAPVSGFVSAVLDDLGLTFQPDPESGRDRYLFGISVYLHS